MKQVVLLSQDQKASSQIEQWARDLDEEIALSRHSTLAEFERAYSATKAEPSSRASGDPLASAQGPPDPAPGPGVGPAPASQAEGTLLIADAEALGRDPVAILKRLRERLAEKTQAPVAVLAMSFEGTEGAKDPWRSYRAEHVDDLVLKPLDRSLLLQKMETLLAFDAAASPSFLFRQKTSLIVEMGKESTVDRIAESGFAVRNPAPLADGVFARVRCDLFGSGPDRAVYGRSYRSERHPQHPGEYLVYFSFFGVGHAQLLNVRKFIRSQAGFRARGASAPAVAKPNPMKRRPGGPTPIATAAAPARGAATPGKGGGALPAEPAKPVVHLAAVDVDPFALQELAEALESNFVNVEVHRFPSYGSFLASLKPAAGSSASTLAEATAAAAAPPPAGSMDLERAAKPEADASAAGIGRERLSVVVRSGTLEVVQVDPALGPSERAFGMTDEEIRDRPDGWLDAFENDERRELAEFVAIVAAGRSAGRALRAGGGGRPAWHLEARARVERADESGEALVRMDLKPISPEAYAKLSGTNESRPPATGYAAVFVDGTLAPDDVEAWGQGLRDAVAAVSGGQTPRRPQLIVLGDEGSRARPERFRSAHVRDFVSRPLDRRLLVEKTSLAVEGLELASEAPEAEFHVCSARALVAKDVEIEEFSEYGAVIKHASALRDDAFLGIFAAPLTGDDPEPVWARCALCEPAGEDGSYRCYFRFFGVGEHALKRVRSWIREDYVHKKDGAA